MTDIFDDLSTSKEATEAEERARRHAAEEAADTRVVTMESFFREAPPWLWNLLLRMKPWHSIEWSRGGSGGTDWFADVATPDQLAAMQETEDVEEVEEVEEDPDVAAERAQAETLVDHVAFDGRVEAKHLADAEAVSSHHSSPWTKTDMHVLALDIDVPAALIPSSTPGHSHLIIDRPLSEEAWREIVTVLGKHGIIEDGYAAVSLKRGATFLRAPWVRKGMEQFDRVAAYSWWLDSEHDILTREGIRAMRDAQEDDNDDDDDLTPPL